MINYRLLFLFLTITFSYSAFGQKVKSSSNNKESLDYYKEGLKAFEKENYKLADSLYTLSAKLLPHPDTYYNLALTKFHLNDSCGFCNNLKLAANLSDKESEKLFFSRCIKIDTIIYKNKIRKDTNLYKINTQIICENYSFQDYFIKNLESGTFSQFYIYSDSNLQKNKKEFLESYSAFTEVPKEIISSEIFDCYNQNLKPYTFVEKMPEFPGGDEQLMQFLRRNVIYPQAAKETGKQGTIYVTFIICKTGKIISANILKGVSKELDEEALRVVKLMPNWEPGVQYGRAVSVQFTLPIKFILQ